MERLRSAGSYEQFGSYLLLRPLGKGGMGVVYIARTRRKDRPLAALKRLRPDCLYLPGFAERFWHEGMLALRLSHPNVVETIDVGEADSTQYVASELIFGKDTALISEQAAQTGVALPLEVALKILSDTLHGLAYVHQARETDGRPLELVHRDITPGNVLVGYDGTTRLADFGLASSALSETLALTRQGTVMGTPKYLAPEVLMGEKATQSADIYGLGAVMYRLLAGVPPYDGGLQAVAAEIAAGPPIPVAKRRPGLPLWVSEFVDHLMERDPGQRPASASIVAEELDSWTKDHGLPTESELGRWLTKLFAAEYEKEMREAEALVAIDPSAIPQRVEGTRVLKVSPEDRLLAGALTEPVVAPDRRRDHDTGPTHLGAPPSRSKRVPLPELLATQIKRDYVQPDAETPRSNPVSELPAVEEVRTDKRPVPIDRWDTPPLDHEPMAMRLPATESIPAELVRPIVDAPVPATPPVVSMAPLVSTPVSRWGTILVSAVVALFVGVLGVFAGMRLMGLNQSIDAHRWEMIERLGSARKTLASLRAKGAHVPSDGDRQVERVKQAIAEERWPDAQLILQELEVEIALDSTSTDALRK